MSSLKKITEETKLLAEAHEQIRTFEYGEFLDIIKSNSIEYSLCMMNVVQAPLDPNGNKKTLAIDLMIMDRVFKGNANVDDVENSTLEILCDLLGVMFWSPRWQNFGEITTISIPNKFREKGADLLTGWGVTINFDLRTKWGYCDAPFDSGYDFDLV